MPKLTEAEKAIRGLSEAWVQARVTTFLTKNGWWWEARPRMVSRGARTHQPGMTDLIAVHKTTFRVAFIEVKREQGQLRQVQVELRDLLVEAHDRERVLYLLAKPSTLKACLEQLSFAGEY